MIYIVSEVTTAPGARDQVLTLFQDLVPQVLAEDGCIEYLATCDAEDAPRFRKANGADRYLVLERWTDMAAFRAHVKAAHMAGFAALTSGLIVERAVSILRRA